MHRLRGTFFVGIIQIIGVLGPKIKLTDRPFRDTFNFSG